MKPRHLCVPLLASAAGAAPSGDPVSPAPPLPPQTALSVTDLDRPSDAQRGGESLEEPCFAILRRRSGGSDLILGLWEDGWLVWSADPIFGGPPLLERPLRVHIMGGGAACPSTGRRLRKRLLTFS